MKSLEKFNDLMNKYKDDVDMYIVYISEAHPLDGWAIKAKNQPKHFQHKSMEERLRVAKEFQDSVKSITEAPVLVDDFTNNTEKYFGASPERLVVMDKSSVAFIGGPGPMKYSIEKAADFLATIVEKRN